MSLPYYEDTTVTLHHGDSLTVLRTLPSGSVDCCVTFPPYFGLRDYGVDGQLGAESSPAEYVDAMRAVFAEVRRVLADDGTLWLNLGDSYSGSWGNQGRKPERGTQRPITTGMIQPVADGRYGDPGASNTGAMKPGAPPAKNLLGMPWRVAFALQDDGWILRNDIIWAKPNGMPESITDRLSTKHEHVFMLSKARRYWFDLEPLREPAVTTRPGALSWSRDSKEADVPGHSMRQHRADRPQKRRAAELFAEAGLTDAHLVAMRAVGMGDAGKAQTTQSGTGKNAPEMQRLADEAKAALGGYYREFLYDGGRNPGDVWTIATQPFAEAHFATMPPALAERCILAGCKPGGTVLDPFSGSGTTGLAATKHGRRYVGIDLNAEYLDLSLRTRLAQGVLLDGGV
jgi:site-specific DNA-methyltransferase (cytosine-N4-specific)